VLQSGTWPPRSDRLSVPITVGFPPVCIPFSVSLGLGVARRRHGSTRPSVYENDIFEYRLPFVNASPYTHRHARHQSNAKAALAAHERTVLQGQVDWPTRTQQSTSTRAGRRRVAAVPGLGVRGATPGCPGPSDLRPAVQALPGGRLCRRRHGRQAPRNRRRAARVPAGRPRGRLHLPCKRGQALTAAA